MHHHDPWVAGSKDGYRRIPKTLTLAPSPLTRSGRETLVSEQRISDNEQPP